MVTLKVAVRIIYAVLKYKTDADIKGVIALDVYYICLTLIFTICLPLHHPIKPPPPPPPNTPAFHHPNPITTQAQTAEAGAGTLMAWKRH